MTKVPAGKCSVDRDSVRGFRLAKIEAILDSVTQNTPGTDFWGAAGAISILEAEAVKIEAPQSDSIK